MPFQNPKKVTEFNWYSEIGFIETKGPLVGGTKEALKRLEGFRKHISNYKEARDTIFCQHFTEKKRTESLIFF